MATEVAVNCSIALTDYYYAVLTALATGSIKRNSEITIEETTALYNIAINIPIIFRLHGCMTHSGQKVMKLFQEQNALAIKDIDMFATCY